MRRVIGVAVALAFVLGPFAHEGAAQTTARGGEQLRTTASSQVDWSTVADKAMKGADAAVRHWQQGAGFVRGRVNASLLSTSPGDLQGPSMLDPMKSRMAADGVPLPIAEKFARVFDSAWSRWQAAYMVPGLPVYPAFAAFPAPAAPPTPNVPFHVGAGASPGATALTPVELAKALKLELGAVASEPAAQKAIDAFAVAAASSFADFLATSLIMQVMGKGPVPSFAPLSPAGPVAAGDILPGQHFVSGGGFASGSTLTAFEALLGQWKVKLESGKAYKAAERATLVGTISIRRDGWPVSFRLRDAVLRLETGAPPGAPAPTQQQEQQLQRGATAAGQIAVVAGAVVLTVFTAGAGSAVVEVLVGGTTLTYAPAGVSFTRRPDGSLGFSVDTFASDVCRIQLGPGSRVVQSGALLDWKMTCPEDVTSSGDLLLEPGGLSGNGSIRAFGATLGATYSLDAARRQMRIKGSWTPASTGWRGIPGMEQQLEYAAESPSVAMEWTLPAAPVTDPKRDALPRSAFTFGAGKVSVRTKATRPGGSPWATATTSGLSAQLSYDGTIRAPFPQPPQPPPEPLAAPLCNASCGFLKDRGLSGVIPPAPPVLKYNADQSRCDVPALASCGGPTTCGPGQTMVDDGGKKKCRLPAPAVPKVPDGIKIRQIVP